MRHEGRTSIGRGCIVAALGFLSTLMATTAAAQGPVTTGTVSMANAPVSPAEEQVNQAADLMDDNRWGDAIALLDAVIAADPRNARALANRAMCYAQTNRVEQATRDLAAAEAVQPVAAVNHRVRAVLANRLSDKTTELAELTKSLTLEPGNPYARIMRSWLLQEQNREPEALANAAAFLDARPDNPDAYLLLARLHIAQRRPVMAEEIAQSLLKEIPDHPITHRIAAQIYSDAGNRAEAVAQIGKAIQLKADDARLFYTRATYRKWDDLSARKADLDKAAALDPRDLDIVYSQANFAFESGDWNGAITGFKRILAEEPKDFGMLAYLAMAQAKAGAPGEAKKTAALALGSVSGPGDLGTICRVMALEGILLDVAVTACDEALRSDPQSARFLKARGLLNLRLGKLDAAEADYTRSLSLDDRDADAFYGRAIVRWRKDDRAAALADLSAAQSLDALVDESFRRVGLRDLPQKAAL